MDLIIVVAVMAIGYSFTTITMLTNNITAVGVATAVVAMGVTVNPMITIFGLIAIAAAFAMNWRTIK